MSESQEPDQYAAFATKWVKAQPIVAAFISSVVWNHHDAEDLLQRTATAAIHKHVDFDPERSFEGWVVGLAKIEIRRYRQERSRDRLDFTDEAVDRIAEAYQADPAELHEMKHAISVCVEKLKGRPKQALELVAGEGLPVREAAENLGITVNAIVMATHRARNLLRQCIERQMGESGVIR